MGLSTPDTSHLRDPQFASVYEPAEDTYLLLDALENDRARLHAQRPTICVEIGSGSGCVSAFLGQVLAPHGSLIISTDINPAATLATQQTTERSSGPAVFTQCRMRFVQALEQRLQGSIDVLVFNPPYVVTPEEEVGGTGEAAAWAGGCDGRVVVDQLLPHVSMLLAPGGAFYLVVIEENRPDEIIQLMTAQGLDGERVLERRAGRERLSVLRFTKKQGV
ncbi:HemK methyltransferase member 2 [Coemansia sp. RSA 2703]|nr:HemK methyltransferase member 2 [Coemansia sp. RSA 2703]KAJ2376734.1 HemK methyltransferase member 2 [Coemansia sp. RSA 2607]KAJ2383544.1 HemK methyltransferase member 2 [Coemansia sp. RSA 2603]